MSNLSYQPNEVYQGHTSPKEYTVSIVQTRNNVTAIEAERFPPRKVNEAHYMVDSFNTTLLAYHVRRNEVGVWECSCPHFTFHFECKHVTHLLEHLRSIEPRYIVRLKRRVLRPMHALTTEPVKALSVVSEVVDCPLSAIFGFD